MGTVLKVMIHKLLDENNISMRELGRRTDIRTATLHELANHKRQNIHFEHLNRIADALGITDVRKIITFDEIATHSLKQTGMKIEIPVTCTHECKRFLIHSPIHLHNDLMKTVR
ncbi:XRE family transcriptional regulator [Robertmurraya yapensis]|uniref:XRE family transcriptional regulator n=1 Tax=Bacillus yapensis TaxID=2492960 RepID=A0A3S0LF22_9BACI|nr:XRE family transcriptional regulator [Bacillus yapensis]TKS97257.1 helix-turn-helix transcriptional regulator [Bacillus yapensis]